MLRITRDDLLRSFDKPFPQKLDPISRVHIASIKQEHLFITGPKEEKEQFRIFIADFTRTFRCNGSSLFDETALKAFNNLPDEYKNKNIQSILANHLSITPDQAKLIIAAYSQFVTSVVSTLLCARINDDITSDPLGVSKFVFTSGVDPSRSEREFLLDVNIVNDRKDEQIKLYCTQSIALRNFPDEKFCKIPNGSIKSEFTLRQRKKRNSSEVEVGFQLETVECPAIVYSALKNGENLSLSKQFIEPYFNRKQPETKHAATWSARMFETARLEAEKARAYLSSLDSIFFSTETESKANSKTHRTSLSVDAVEFHPGGAGATVKTITR